MGISQAAIFSYRFSQQYPSSQPPIIVRSNSIPLSQHNPKKDYFLILPRTSTQFTFFIRPKTTSKLHVTSHIFVFICCVLSRQSLLVFSEFKSFPELQWSEEFIPDEDFHNFQAFILPIRRVFYCECYLN